LTGTLPCPKASSPQPALPQPLRISAIT
jgi:hypothetical protein